MKLKFEHDYQQKIMIQAFEEPFRLDSASAVQAWRSAWMQELKTWHSPYKLILDCSNLEYVNSDDTQQAMSRMLKFFEGLFLRSITGYGMDQSKGHSLLPFKIVTSFEEAQREAGVRGMRDPKAPVDFRSTIQFQNHFAQHVIEMTFSDDVVIDTKEKVDAIKSKLTNNLMQWHSKWSLLVDCSRVRFDPAMRDHWEKMDKFFKGFFMKVSIGYSPSDTERDHYPFPTFRARHTAVAKLENEGMFMGNEAQCRSKTST